jgi:hypothetical protein
MWVDNWHSAGALFEQYGFRVVYDAESRLEAKLSIVIIDGDWCWRPAKSDALVEIQSHLLEIKIGVCNKPIWSTFKKGFYVNSDTWDALKIRKTKVDWWQLVWFPYIIPKHAFVLWLAMMGRLFTSDRLSKWGYKGDVLCLFYRSGMESRDIFFLLFFLVWFLFLYLEAGWNASVQYFFTSFLLAGCDWYGV